MLTQKPPSMKPRPWFSWEADARQVISCAAWPEPPLPGPPQAEEKQLAVAEKAIRDLQQRSQEVAPLPQRRNKLQQPLRVDSICDWDSGEVQALPALPLGP